MSKNPFEDVFNFNNWSENFQCNNFNFDQFVADSKKIAQSNTNAIQAATKALFDGTTAAARASNAAAEGISKNVAKFTEELAKAKTPEEALAKQAKFLQNANKECSENANQIAGICSESAKAAKQAIDDGINSFCSEVAKTNNSNNSNKKAA